MDTMRGLVPGDIPAVAAALDTDEARAFGVHINVNELLMYLVSPWIRAYVRVIDGEFAGFAAFNISEAHWGRCELQEFYVPAKWRCKGHQSWKFYSWLIQQASCCHRITAHVKDTNMIVGAYLTRAGWQQEAVLTNYDIFGNTYLQYVMTGGREK